jgi:predicted TIM-barrel fold metal-dependent hydrolase
VLRDAIRTKGFVGLKLYPPMGFRPWGNDPERAYGQQIRATGADINAELERLYRWCAREDVPIKAHGNNSLAAEACSGQNAAPDLWAPALEAFPDLRVNIAHFGGFEEDHVHDDDTANACSEMPPSYEERAALLMSDANRAYVDLGYWDEVVGSSAPGSSRVRAVNTLLARNPVLGQRIMYGSDYSMIGRVIGHGTYLSDVTDAIGRLNGADYGDVMRGNAIRYLGLDDPESGTRQRLARFFPQGHPYFALVGA